MNLFETDDLSSPMPELARVDEAGRGAILELLHTQWPQLGLANVELSRVAGAGVLTLNYVLDCGQAKYLLKSRTGSHERERLRREQQLGQRLLGAGVPVARTIAPESGHSVVACGQTTWTLYAFEDGQHFTGQDGELDAAAEKFAQLAQAATGLQDVTTSVHDEVDFLDRLERLLTRGPDEKVRQPQPALWMRHSPTMLESVRAVRSRRLLVEADWSLVHLDYHPANLIMRDGDVACILDLEDVRPYPTVAALGFAGYKLIRRMRASDGILVTRPDLTLARRWLAGWERYFPGGGLRTAHLRLGAEYRVLALLHLIIDRYVTHGDDRFLYDLPKQIRSLYELPIVFGATLPPPATGTP